MNYFRVSKYNLLYVKNGVYTLEDWTSFCDIGKTYNGEEFTAQEFEEIAYRYINMVKEILSILKIYNISIIYLEMYLKEMCEMNWSEYKTLEFKTIDAFIMDCLKERCWGQMSTTNFIWETGYDFYMHIGCDLEFNVIKRLAQDNRLYVEKWDVINKIDLI